VFLESLVPTLLILVSVRRRSRPLNRPNPASTGTEL
jgi:hypothetical protein